jgi:hypothetical protein
MIGPDDLVPFDVGNDAAIDGKDEGNGEEEDEEAETRTTRADGRSPMGASHRLWARAGPALDSRADADADAESDPVADPTCCEAVLPGCTIGRAAV